MESTALQTHTALVTENVFTISSYIAHVRKQALAETFVRLLP